MQQSNTVPDKVTLLLSYYCFKSYYCRHLRGALQPPRRAGAYLTITQEEHLALFCGVMAQRGMSLTTADVLAYGREIYGRANGNDLVMGNNLR